MPTFHAIATYAAAQRIKAAVRRTELRRSEAMSAYVGGDVQLKLECEQVTGSFKIRGAFNVLASLPEEVRRRGVVAASAGNHGMGVAHAAREFGVEATVYVPSSVPQVKRDGIAALGARIDDSADHFDGARDHAMEAARRDGATFIHPCEGEVLIAGQGTVGLEILEDLPDVRTLVVPVGGAGLVSGIASIVRAVAPEVRIVGVATEHTDALARAVAAGHPVTSNHRPTIAEGLAGDADAYALELAQFAVDEFVIVTEDATASAVAWLFRNESLTVEGSAAVGIAALLERKVTGPAPTAVVVTGRNIDPERHAEILRKWSDG